MTYTEAKKRKSSQFVKFLSAGRHTFLTTQNGNFGSKANEKGRKRSISTYDMKIQKHQRKLSKKSTSSKTEVALLSLHSMLKWFSVQCVLTKQNKTAHLTDRYSMMMGKLNMKCNRSKKE